MKITVAICTWNRARLLDQTLESLSKMELPGGVDWEVVVVDNNSTELAIPLVLSGWRKELPLVTAIEKQQGHSFARNRAVELATGDYIVWTDNDVIVGKHWLRSYAKAFREHPEYAFFGGAINPVFENEKPDWIDQTWSICAPVFASRDLGDQAIDLAEDRLPYGANFAIRTDIQNRFLFDPKWGRKTTSMIGEDEVAVLRAVSASGEKGKWVPEANLDHMIPADRATPEYVSAYYYGQGVTNVLKGKVDRSRFSIWCDWLKCRLGYGVFRNFAQPEYWVSKMVHASICKGELAGLKLNRDVGVRQANGD